MDAGAVTIIQLQWLAFIASLWMLVLMGVYMALGDLEVVKAAEKVRLFSETQRQFELFIRTVNQEAPRSGEDIPDSSFMDSAASTLIVDEARRLGLTPQEFLKRVSRVLEGA